MRLLCWNVWEQDNRQQLQRCYSAADPAILLPCGWGESEKRISPPGINTTTKKTACAASNSEEKRRIEEVVVCGSLVIFCREINQWTCIKIRYPITHMSNKYKQSHKLVYIQAYRDIIYRVFFALSAQPIRLPFLQEDISLTGSWRCYAWK